MLLLSSVNFFFKVNFFWNTVRVSNGLDRNQDRLYAGPDLVPDRLQRLLGVNFKYVSQRRGLNESYPTANDQAHRMLVIHCPNKRARLHSKFICPNLTFGLSLHYPPYFMHTSCEDSIKITRMSLSCSSDGAYRNRICLPMCFLLINIKSGKRYTLLFNLCQRLKN